MQQALDGDVEGVTRLSGHDGGPGGRRDIAAAWRCRIGLVDVTHAADRVLDGAIAGAPAQIALERGGEIVALGLVQARGGHDHAGRAKPALETLRLQEGALHRMQRAVARETFDGRDLAAVGAERRDEAAVHGLAVEQHAAGAAVAGVAALLHPEPPSCRRKVRRHWPGRGVAGERVPLTSIAHGAARGAFAADLLGELQGHVLAPGRRAVQVVEVLGVGNALRGYARATLRRTAGQGRRAGSDAASPR